MLVNPSIEEVFFNKYCLCGHLLEEPEELPEHADGKCYYLDDSELIVWACKCKELRPIPFTIKVEIYNAEISADTASASVA